AKAFPEQIERLGLEPWRVSKVYALWDKRDGSQVIVDGNTDRARLEAGARDYAAAAAGLLADAPRELPAERFFRLLDSKAEGAAGQANFRDGVPPAPAGVSRRQLPALTEPGPEAVKAKQARLQLRTLMNAPAQGLADPGKLLALVGPALAKL